MLGLAVTSRALPLDENPFFVDRKSALVATADLSTIHAMVDTHSILRLSPADLYWMAGDE